MASTIIHMAVAKKINEKLNRNEKLLLLGSVAPDLSKTLKQGKNKSHFFHDNKDRSGLDEFLNKYPKFLENDYDTGYYIHLCTDYLWFNKFFPTFRDDYNNKTILLNKEVVTQSGDDFAKLIYEDYVNLNVPLLDVYNMDLSLFYEETDIPNTSIDEVDVSKIQMLLDEQSLFIKKNKLVDNYNIMSMEMIEDFVKYSVVEILDELLNYNKY